MSGSALVVRADALRLPLPDASVDLIVSSPPYYSLRSYRDGDEHYEGQIGSEPTPQAFLEALWAVMHECWRVLKPSGSCFINLGDKRAGSGGHNNSGISSKSTLSGNGHIGGVGRAGPQKIKATLRNPPDRYNQAAFGRPKSKMLLPHRFAIGCEDGQADPEGKGWVMRQDVVWQKLNCLSGGTQVYVRINGRPTPIKLHDLCRCYQPENVQLWNGSAWTQVLGWEPTGRHPDALDSMKAIRAARRTGGEPVPAADLEIELRSGERIGCTREHRWPTQRGLVESSALLVGDVIDAAPLPAGEVFPGMLDDEEVGWFVGLYIAEGSRSERMIQIAGHAREVDRFKRLRDLASSIHATCNVYTNGNQGNVTMAGRFLDAILDTYVGGKTAKDKHLRPKAWERSNAFLRAVLDGYLSGDGGYNAKADRWQLGFTANDQWAADLRTLGGRLGVSVRLRRGTVTGFDREWPAWLGTLYMDPTRRKQPDSQVVAIRQSRARQFWDVAVADDPHLFSLASGVLTHNSLPESVTDRCRDSHEYLFHFTKSERYFAAVDEVREPHAEHTLRYYGPGTSATQRPKQGPSNAQNGTHHLLNTVGGLGKLPGSVWALPSEPLIISDEVKAHYDLPDHFACLDDQTEILTKRGWLRHDALTVGDEVAGYNLDLGRAEWTRCHGVHRYEYDGDLVAVDKANLSMRLTPNHRCVVQATHWETKRPGHTHVVRADEMAPKHFIPRSAEWMPFEDKSIGEDMAALCGWVAAEGWFTPTGEVRLCQSLTTNPEKVVAIDRLLARMPMFMASRSGRKTFRASILGLRRYLDERPYLGRPNVTVNWALPLGLAQELNRLMPGKLLPWSFVGLPESERRAVLDAFIDGDGHRRPDGRIGIYQKLRQNLDVLQAIAVTLGYKTNLTSGAERHVLYLTAGGRPLTLRSTGGKATPVGREHYTGIVWCPTTGTGTFFARRNGSVFITGNSFPTELVRRVILGWSPSGICTGCNKARFGTMEYVKEASQRPVSGLNQGDGGLHRLRENDGQTGLRSPGQEDETLPCVTAQGQADFQGDRRGTEVRREVCGVPHTEALGGGREGAAERDEAASVLLRFAIDGEGHVPDALQQMEAPRHSSPAVRQTGRLIYVCDCTPYTDHPERRGKDWNRGLDRGNGNRVPVKEEETRGPVREYHLDGWTPPPTKPARVLDIFGGTGTTAGVARALGRTGISVDLSHDYSRLARWRIERSGHFARVVNRTHRENQGDLFGATA